MESLDIHHGKTLVGVRLDGMRCMGDVYFGIMGYS